MVLLNSYSFQYRYHVSIWIISLANSKFVVHIHFRHKMLSIDKRFAGLVLSIIPVRFNTFSYFPFCLAQKSWLLSFSRSLILSLSLSLSLIQEIVEILNNCIQMYAISGHLILPSRNHLHTKVTPDFHLIYSKNGRNLGSESK